MAMPGLSADATGQFALDANALAGLKAQARSAPGEAAAKAAGQFEALFLQMLMKQMRDALPQDGPLSSDASKSYTTMFDHQIAQQLSNRGIGLRKVIEQQLSRQLGTASSAADAGAAGAAGTALGSALANRIGAMTGKAAVAGKSAAAPPPVTGSGVVTTATAGSSAGTGLLPAGVEAFIEKMRPHAEAVAQAVGIPVHYLLAQAGLETGWGKSLPRTSSGDTSHNLFGIKAGIQWKGNVADASTTEVVAGQTVRSVERFRAYGSFGEAFQDFGNLIKDSARYAGVLAKVGNPRAYAEGLQRAGYATDPQYGAKLARSIELVARQLGVQAGPIQVVPPGADKSRTAIQAVTTGSGT